jgi:DnaJ-class molecular chaperone
LGRIIQIDTLGGGKVEVKIPMGHHLNEEIRIKGEGMTKGHNLVVKFDVQTPKEITPEAKSLLEELEKLLK